MNGVFSYIEISNELDNQCILLCIVPMSNSVHSVATLEVEQHKTMLSRKTSSSSGGTQKLCHYYLHTMHKEKRADGLHLPPWSMPSVRISRSGTTVGLGVSFLEACVTTNPYQLNCISYSAWRYPQKKKIAAMAIRFLQTHSLFFRHHLYSYNNIISSP